MFSLTAEAVRALAPDAAALSSGRGLASPARWSGLGRNDRALWGRCQGSGKDPYEVGVDLEGPAYRCSCPSRKFPCKHAIGLMLLATDHAAALPHASPPDATSRWLDGRAARGSAAAKAPESIDAAREVDPARAAADEKARAKRAATRERRVELGIEELRLWLADLARRGLAELATEGTAPFEAAAARLVDAQAGGLARMVRGAGARVAGGRSGVPGRRGGPRGRAGGKPDGHADETWADDLLDAAGRLYLLVESWGRRESLPAPLLAEVRALVGFSIREADIPDDVAVEDRWLVVGRRHEPDERLRATRTWLRGEASGRFAVIMDWQPVRAAPANEPPVGSTLRGMLAFYPGPLPLRAAIRAGWTPAGDDLPADGVAAATWREAVGGYATALAANPWLERHPVLVAGLVPVRQDGRAAYRDATGETVPLRMGAAAGDALHAFAGGRPVMLFGEWDGLAFSVLAAGNGRRWIPLPGTEDVVADEAVSGGEPPANAAWDELRGWAMLGTSRSTPDAALGPLLARMADRSPEDRLLALAASLAVRRRATPVLVPAADATPVPAAPDETIPTASPAAARALVGVMGAPALMREWLALARDARVTAPPELVPRLVASDAVRDLEGIDDVLGARGAWLSGAEEASPGALARMREARDAGELAALLGDPLRAAGRPAREVGAVLRALRTVDPPRARGWIEAAWPALTGPAYRTAMLDALEIGLGPGDAALLDQVVAGDTNKARREQAATLACRAPGSAVRDRIEARARALVRRKGLIGHGIELATPSDDAIADMEHDGMVLEAYFAQATIAQRRDRIVAWHVDRVAPARWAEWLRLSPADVVAAFAGVRDTRMIFAIPLARAVAAHRDGTFAEALAAAMPEAMAGYGTDIWTVIPRDRREAVVGQTFFVRSATTGWGTAASLGRALECVPRPWSAELTTLVRYDVGRTLDGIKPGQDWLAKARLETLITHVPAGMLAEVGRLIDERAVARPELSGLTDLAALVAARRALNDAFAAEGATGGDR